MALFINEDGKQLTKKQVIVPDKLVDKLKLNKSLFSKYKDTDGYKRVSAIVDDDYNKRSNKKDRIHNDKHTISFSDLKRIDHDMRHMNQNKNNAEYQVLAGDDMRNWAHHELRKLRTSVKKVKQVPEVPKLQNTKVKTPEVKKDVKIGNASVRLTEAKDWHPYYDILSEINVYDILGEYYYFGNRKPQTWEQIDPNMYKKALSEFTKYGKLIHFPSKYIYQWIGMMMRNVAKLTMCTELAGHSAYFPSEDVTDFFSNHPDLLEKYSELGVNVDEIDAYDFDEWAGFLDVTGFYDWLQLPDGSQAVSDFGIQPLEKIISEYSEDSTPEETLVIINKMMDVVHCRGDLASMFIKGGTKTLTQISEEVKKKNKKISLTENQLLLIKEYRNQLVFNFDDEGEPYFKKDNWQHYIDFLESIGTYGELPGTNYSKSDITSIVEKNSDEAFELRNTYDDDNIDESVVENMFWKIIYTHNGNKYIDENNEAALKVLNYKEWENENYRKYPCEVYAHQAFLEECLGGYDYDTFVTILSDLGFEELEKSKKQVWLDNMYEYGFPDDIVLNERGLIYVERAIEIPRYNSPKFNARDGYRKFNDYYKYLHDIYRGVGECWTWEEGMAESYCASGFHGGQTKIILKGWVSPDVVNWPETIKRNCYGLNEEREIYIDSGNAKVELFAIEIEDKNILNGPIVVPVNW